MKISNRSHKSRKTVGAILAVAVVGVSLLASERSTRAIDYTWIGNFGGSTTSFNDPTQWTSSGGTFPGDTTGSADTAQITGAVTGVVNINLNTVLSTPLTGTTLTTTSGSSANATANLNFNISAAQTQSLGTFVLTSGSATVGRVTAIATASASAGATTLSNANLTASTGSILTLTSLSATAADTSIVKADGGTLTTGNVAWNTSVGTLTATNGGFLNVSNLGTSGSQVIIQLNGGSMKITGWTTTNAGGPGINVTGTGNLDASGATFVTGPNISFPTNFTFASSGTTTIGGISLNRTLSPVTGSTNDTGLHFANGVVIVTNSVGVDNGNSSGAGEIHSGTLTVGGSITIGFSTSTSRWGQFLVAGTGVANATTGGVQIGSAAMGSLGITGGTLSTSKINFGTATSTTMGGTVGLGAGNLYLGSASISTDVLSKTATTNLARINLNSGTLGATADWLSAANMTLGGTTSIKAADLSNTPHNISLSGVLSGTGGFTKIGGGTLSLNGASLYSGATAINAGVLNVTNTTGSATGTSAVTVASGAQVISPAGLAGSMNGAVTIQNGGTLSPGGTSVGTLTMSNLTLAGGSNLVINFNDSSNFSQIAMGGTGVLSYNSTVNVFAYIAGTTTPFVFPATGDFTLISGITNADVAPIPQFTLAAGDTSAAGTYAFQIAGGKLQLHLGVLQDLKYYWSGSTSTTWGAGGNWDKVNAPNAFPNAIGDIVEFNATKQIGGGPVGNMTPTLTDNRTAGVLDFNSTGYTLAATNGTLNLQGAVNSNINLGNSVNATISAPLALGTNLVITLSSGATLQVSGNIMDGANGSKGITAAGSGVVTLSGTETYSGTTNVTGGSLVLTGVATFGNGTGAVTNTGGVITTGVSATYNNAFSNTGTLTFTANNNTLNGAFTGTGALVVGGDSNTFSAAVATGSLVASGAHETFAAVTAAGAVTATGNGDTFNSTITTSGTSGSVTLGSPGGGTITVSGLITATGAIFIPSNNNSLQGITGGAAGMVLSGNNNTIAGNYNLGAGTGTITGSGNIFNGTLQSANGAYLVNNAGVTTFNGNVSTNGSITMTGGGSLILAGANTSNNNTFIPQGTILVSGTMTTGTNTGNVAVGTTASNIGVLDVASTGTVLATTTNADTILVGQVANATGLVKLRGGSIVLGTGTGTGTIGLGNSLGAFAALDMTSGVIVNKAGANGAIAVGGTNDVALLNESGGSITVASVFVATAAGAKGVANVNNAQMTATTLQVGSNGGNGVLTISNNGLLTNTTAVIGVAGAGVGIVNLDGGTLASTSITTTAGTGVLNLNGGTLAANGANLTVSGLTHVYANSNTTIDTGSSSVITMSSAIEAPAGSGVATIPMTSNGSGYLTAPLVTITGGDGLATGVATFSGGSVTGIVVTNKGNNYSSAVVTLSGGGATTPATANSAGVTFSPNNLSASLTKVGSGTLILGSATVASLQNFTGSVNVTNGTLQLAHTNAARQSSTSGVLVQLSGLTIAPGSSFDITNHDLIIHYGSESAANAGYTNLFASAASAFAGGSWSGKGLTTSEADATQNGATVIMIESGDDFLGNVGGTFDGHAVTNGDVLVKYTLFGDVNLDGVTNDGDLGLIFGFYDPLGNGGLGGNGPMVGGDSNYDGFVGDGDLGAVFNLYDPFSVGPGLGGGFHGLDAPSTAAVPEPASLAILSLAACGLLGRRRRKDVISGRCSTATGIS